MENVVIPKWLVIWEENALTVFNATYAADAFYDGFKVYKVDLSSGILGYDLVKDISQIYDAEEAASVI